MEDKLIAVVKYPQEKPQTVALEKGLKPLQEIVGGMITGADLPNIEDVFGFANDEGLLIGLEPNIYRPEYEDALVGPLVFVGAGDEGDSISLTSEQVKQVTDYLDVNSVNDFGEFLYHVETGFAHTSRKGRRKCEKMETKLNGYTLKILPDESPLNPRTDCDHLGTLLAWHRDYDLGDNKYYPEPEIFFESEEAKRIYASLPVYLLDHSSLYLSTTGFADVDPDRWDWGRLGIIYCTEEQAKKWLGDDCTPERATKVLYDEIEEYDAYLNGSYYGFAIEGPNGEHEDSCWGFRHEGDNQDLLNAMKEYVSDEFRPLFDKLAAQAEKRACM